LAVELIKYCALAQSNGGLIIDADSPMLTTLEDLLGEGLPNNVALLNDEYVPQAIHGAFLYLKDGTIAKQMVNLLTKTPLEELKASPIILITRGLYSSIATDSKVSVLQPGITTSGWYLLQHKCTIGPVRGGHTADSVSSYNISNSYRSVLCALHGCITNLTKCSYHVQL
jgi:hypothetical protein